MTNSKFKLLLDNLRALILKSRPAYRDYIGTEDVIEKTVLISGKLSADGESVNAKDAFKGFDEGETYKVTIGEEAVDATAQYGTGSFSGCIVIGSSNVTPSAEISGWMICVYNENLLGYGTGEWAGKSVEVFTEKTVRVDRWDVKKLPEECLPDGVAKQRDVDASVDALTSAVQAAQTTADNAIAASDNTFTFTITPVDGQVSPTLSATRAEMLAALDAGKTLLGYWTETRTILDTTDTIKHEFRLESVNGAGADRGLTFVNYEQFYKSTLYVNGNDTISFVDKEVLPVPMTKTDAMTQSVGMDDDGRLWTEPGASGLPEGATAFQQLVTDSDGNTVWTDRPGGYTQKFTGDYVYAKGDDAQTFHKFCQQNGYKIGDTITVVCNGVTYENVPITTNDDGGVHLEQADVFSFGNVHYFGGGTYGSDPDTFPDGVTEVTFKNVHQMNDVLIPMKYLPTDIEAEKIDVNAQSVSVTCAVGGALTVFSPILAKGSVDSPVYKTSGKVDFYEGQQAQLSYDTSTSSLEIRNYMTYLSLTKRGQVTLRCDDTINKVYDVLVKGLRAPVDDADAANKKYVDDTKLIVSSSTAGSTKKFKITVDDTGTLTTTEITTA